MRQKHQAAALTYAISMGQHPLSAPLTGVVRRFRTLTVAVVPR
jgi:hypothetical protein